jgi:uncharacterized membrane protein YqhA
MLAVFSTFVGSLSLFVWASIKTAITVYHAFGHGLESFEGSVLTAHFVSLLDTFLLAVILYIFAVALYELFIGEVKLPDWLIIKDLDGLKKKLSSVIALMLAVTFLEHLTEWTDPKGTLMFAVAVAAVIFALIFYMKTEPHDKH